MAVNFSAIAPSPAYGTRVDTIIDSTPLGTIADGDLLLLAGLTASGGTPPTMTPPTGFTILAGTWPMTVTAGGFNLSFWVWSKPAAGESGNYTISHASASAQASLMRITGASSDPFHPACTQNSGVDSTTTWTGLTTTVDGTLIVLEAFNWGGAANDLVPPTGTTPTFTERLEVDPLIYVATGTLTTAGATGDKTQTPNNSNTGNPWGAVMIAVQPSGAAFPYLPTPVVGPTVAVQRAATI